MKRWGGSQGFEVYLKKKGRNELEISRTFIQTRWSKKIMEGFTSGKEKMGQTEEDMEK